METKKFKLNEETLRSLAQKANLSHHLEDVEGVLTLNYLASRLLLAYQMDDTFVNIDKHAIIAQLKSDIVEIIKSLEL